MKDSEHINKVCEQIVSRFRPNKVILFGSYARGGNHGDSDVDLLVVMPYSENELDMMAKVRQDLDSALPLDVLVKTPDQIAKGLSSGDFFTREMIENGIVLYDSGNLGVDR